MYRIKPITFDGETMSVRNWERKLGLAQGSMCNRLKSGWPLSKALTTPSLGGVGRGGSHGHRRGRPSKTYAAWNQMKGRCLSPSHNGYEHYGRRGITVCQRWQESFENFLADMGVAPPGMSLDRIDNNGDYEPGNCRWATPLQQASNRRRNRLITFDGCTLTITAWARRLGLSKGALKYRLDVGMPLNKAMKDKSCGRLPRAKPVQNGAEQPKKSQ